MVCWFVGLLVLWVYGFLCLLVCGFAGIFEQTKLLIVFEIIGSPEKD